MNPKGEWDIIAKEDTKMMDVFLKYFLPLAAVSAIASFIGYGFVGYKVGLFGLSTTVKGIGLGATYGIISLVASCAGFFIGSVVIDALATNFKSEKNINRSAQLVAFSYTPALVAGILNIVPALGILASLSGIYGLVILYFGMSKMKKTPEDQVVVYYIISLLVIIVASAVVSFILFAALVPSMGVGMAGGLLDDASSSVNNILRQ